MNNPFHNRNAKLDPASKARIQQNLVKFASENPVARETSGGFQFLLLMQKPMGALLVAIVAILGVGGGATYAAQDALPGDTLYPVKIASEEARSFVETNDLEKAELELRFAERRQAEIEALVAAGTLKEEHAREAQTHLDESIDEVVRLSKALKDTDATAAAKLALRADAFEDEFVETLKEIPEEFQDEVLELVALAVNAASENNDDHLALIAEVAFETDDEALDYELEREIIEGVAEAKEHAAMLRQAIDFGKTINDAEFTRVLDSVASQLALLESAISRAEAELAKAEPDFIEILNLANQQDIPDAYELFAQIEAYGEANPEVFEGIEYDGPWIDDYDDEYYDDFEDPYAIEGECHTTYEDENVIECFHDGDWRLFPRDVYDAELAPTGDFTLDQHHDDEYEFELPEYPEDWDFEEDGYFYYGEDVDPEFEALRDQYDADRDGEVDCIGDIDCPGPDDPIWDAFDRECDEECERWHEEVERAILEDLERHEEYEDDHDYDPSEDPYSGDEYDYEYDEHDEEDDREHDRE